MRIPYLIKISTVILFCNILFCNALLAQNYFQEIFGGDCYDEGYSIYLTHDNNLIMAGYTCSYNATDDLYTNKVTASGTYLWSRSINILQHERAYSIIECTDDTGLYIYAMTGDTWNDTLNNGKRDAFLMITDTKGIPYWVELFTRDSTNEYGRCIIRGSDDSFVIAGYTNKCDSDSVTFCNDVLLIKTDLSGVVQWIDYVDINKGDDFGFKVIEFNNVYYVTGYTRKDGTSDNDIFLMQVAFNGAVNWIKTYGDTLGDFSYSLKAVSDSNIVMVGHTYNNYTGNGMPDIIVIKTNLNGAPLWKAVYKTNPNQQKNFGRDIIESPFNDGTNVYYITGYSDALNNGKFDVHLINTTTNGVMNWQAVYGDRPENRAYALTMTPDSGLAMVGYTDSITPGSGLLHDKYLVRVTPYGIGCETYLDTNYHYIDSLYHSPSYTVVNDSIFRYEHYSYQKPTDHDSLCFDTTSYRMASFAGLKNAEVNVIYVYSNPVSTNSVVRIVFINSNEQYCNIEVVNILGKRLKNYKYYIKEGTNIFDIPVNDLANGLYMIRVNNRFVEKILIVK